jgi:hypothetical protein
MLNIIGGCYFERCIDPPDCQLFGSGLRAAAGLSNKGFEINLHSCYDNNCRKFITYLSNLYGFRINQVVISTSIEFEYYHPLSTPYCKWDGNIQHSTIECCDDNNFLYYGMLEADISFNGNYVVYDPQNHRDFASTGSTAKHLALVLNKKEAILLSKNHVNSLEEIGKSLLKTKGAEVVIIKNGALGAMVFEQNSTHKIPLFKTDTVWPIGSGDTFSAVFAWQWIVEKKTPYESACLASQYTAQYCSSRHLPFCENPTLEALNFKVESNKIYIAGPFFTIAERWLINEIYNILLDFGNNVFSPYHDVGLIDQSISAESIAKQDLEGLCHSDVILAVLSGMDAGTIFEIGYAISLNKKVIILAQNVKDNDLTMFEGTNCHITNDLTTAIYMATW